MAKTFLKSLAALALLTGNTTGQFLKYHDQVEILTDNLNGATETIGLGLANEAGLGDLDLAKCLQSLEKELRPVNIQVNELDLVRPLDEAPGQDSNSNVYMAFEGKTKVKNEWKYVRLPGVQITTSGKTCSMADDIVDKIPDNLDIALDVDSDDGRRLGRRPRGQGSTNLWRVPNTCLDSSEFEPEVLTGPTHPSETESYRKCWENDPTITPPCNDPSGTGWFTIVEDLDELNQIVDETCPNKGRFDTVALCCDEEFSIPQSGSHTLAGKAGYYQYPGVQACQDQPRSMYGVWKSTSEEHYELMKLHGAWGDDMRRVLFQRLLNWDESEKWEKVALSCYTDKKFVEKDCANCIDPFTM